MRSYLQLCINREGLDYIRKMVLSLTKEEDEDLLEAFMVAARMNAKRNWTRNGYAWFMIPPLFSKSGGYEPVTLWEGVHYRVEP